MMADRRGYSIFDHTADIGLEAFGKTLNEAFENVAKGMFAIMTDDSVIDSKVKKEITLPLECDAEQLVIDWLSELLYLSEVSGLVFGKFVVKINDKLRAVAWGELYSRDKHGYGAQIKAVTYHLLCIKSNKSGVNIRVLLDV